MSILINKDSRVLVVGMTGRIGGFHSALMIDYGTTVVGGVTPGKGGTALHDTPIFNTVKEAVLSTSANTCLVVVPSPFAADAIMEVADAGVRLCVAITEGIPAQDMIRVKRYMRRYRKTNRMRLLGPDSAGVISPGEAMVGVMPQEIYNRGSVGIVSRSGTLGYEAASQLQALGLGVSTSVGIGGDQISGSSYVDILELFEGDADTECVLMLGVSGGPQDANAAAYIEQHMTKPVVAYVAGLRAPQGRMMGHASSIISAFGEIATEKVEMLREAGVAIPASAAQIGETVKQAMADSRGAVE